MDEQSIELDCPPGWARPDLWIVQVIEGTGLQRKEPVSKFFGNWKWDYSEVSEARWQELRPLLKQRIVTLYNRGVIRYGSW